MTIAEPRFVFKCYDCHVELIVSQFADGVVRFLCPECCKRMFAQMGKYGLEKVKCYSEFKNDQS